MGYMVHYICNYIDDWRSDQNIGVIMGVSH